MLRFRIPPKFSIPPPKSNPILPPQNPNFPPLPTPSQLTHHPHPKQFQINAQNSNGDKNDALPGGNGDGGTVEDGRPKLNFRWVDLLLDRDPDNLVAVGLTGLLTWASVQVLWQLLVVSTAILIAAVKYSVVAALLIFILITLL
ncbi:hypothetical protein ACS0TY_009486 [Phlomoides rotata]